MESEQKTARCNIVGCERPQQFVFGDLNVCATHFRIFTVGELGEKATPPWTKERALDALINQDGLEPDVAAKRVERHFGK